MISSPYFHSWSGIPLVEEYQDPNMNYKFGIANKTETLKQEMTTSPYFRSRSSIPQVDDLKI